MQHIATSAMGPNSLNGTESSGMHQTSKSKNTRWPTSDRVMTSPSNLLFSLADHVVVITGAAGLLGRQHADAVAAFGGHPVLLDLNSEAVTALAAELRSTYDVDAQAFTVDITDETALATTCAEVLKHYGKIDALVNNAANNPKVEEGALGLATRLENFSLESWNADISVGLTGAFLCAKHFGTAIFQTSKHGSIVNISSDLGLIAPDQRLYATPGLRDDEQPVKPVTYSVVKTGIIGLTRYLSTYWTHNGRVVVRCNAICPGGVKNGQEPEFVEQIKQRIPLGRMARKEEFQPALVFLLGEASSYVNGAVLAIDGGRTAW